MTHRDFLVTTTAVAVGDELTIDHAHLGHEQNCDLCGAVMFRSEPREVPPHHIRDTVNAPRVNLTVRAVMYVPSAGSFEVSVPIAVCQGCAPTALEPFAAAIRGRQPEAPFLQLLGDEAPTTTAAADTEPEMAGAV